MGIICRLVAVSHKETLLEFESVVTYGKQPLLNVCFVSSEKNIDVVQHHFCLCIN